MNIPKVFQKKTIEEFYPTETEMRIHNFLSKKNVIMQSPYNKYYDFLDSKRIKINSERKCDSDSSTSPKDIDFNMQNNKLFQKRKKKSV